MVGPELERTLYLKTEDFKSPSLIGIILEINSNRKVLDYYSAICQNLEL